MNLQNNLIRAFLLLIMLIGSTMFCMAQNIGNMAKFSFNGDFQNEDKSNTGLFSLNRAETRERTWQIGEIPFRKLAFEYDDLYDLVLNISINYGFDFGGEVGFGCEFEFRFFGFLGLQTGLSYFSNVDYSSSLHSLEQEPTHFVVQIPLLGEFNLPLEFFQVSVFAGIGINLLSFSNHNISITSFSTMSYILGGRLNFAVGDHLNIFASYQYNCDFSDTEYRYKGLKTTYTAERSFLYIGIGWYIPLALVL